ncbi:helix-turn-helix transcriptional regulator [Arthrospiribacter ruber]|jgi:putative transcriptional regulator|uniref:XRE family transcriptional regulator n=1 Tax=Arthrospiribacter ruber TaxID=2487934 RepID=A0A951IU99_9BACT|nr:helix-turn-helix transcriptional regulator [Arthrospiribacter ruber]MBW3466612.1 XRE family transcriptional regulator [Arthrospiribacter ruber]
MEEEIENFKIHLGGKIKKFRKKKGLTQPQLGALINKDYQDVSRVENGKVIPSAYYIWQVSKALEIPIEEFFNFEK